MTTQTSRELSRALRVFRALGDETRLRLVELLRDGEQCVCDLAAELDVGQSLLSFHLKTLKEVGLITDHREGRWVYYAVNREAIDGLVRMVGEMKPARRSPGALRPRCP